MTNSEKVYALLKWFKSISLDMDFNGENGKILVKENGLYITIINYDLAIKYWKNSFPMHINHNNEIINLHWNIDIPPRLMFLVMYR